MRKYIIGIFLLGTAFFSFLLYSLYPTGIESLPKFHGEIFKLILEIGLIGLLAVLIKYLADEYTRKKLHRGDQLSGLLSKRLESYQELWRITAFCNCQNDDDLECEVSEDLDLKCRKQTKKGDVYKEMRTWYFQNGNGFYISHKSKSIYDKIKDLEKSASRTIDLMQKDNELDLLLSKLRSSMKYDCGIYDKAEFNKQQES